MSVGVLANVVGVGSRRGADMNDGTLLGRLDQWARRGWGRFLLLVVVLVVVGTVVVVFLTVVLAASGVLAEDSRFWRGDGPDWAGPVGVVFYLAGLACMGGGFWWLVRNGYYQRHARTRLWARSWSRGRHLVRQVRGTAARRDEDRQLLPLVAEHLIDQPKFMPPLYGVALLQVGQMFIRWAPGFVLIAALFVGALTVGAVRSLQSARRARAFLAEHANGETSRADR